MYGTKNASLLIRVNAVRSYHSWLFCGRICIGSLNNELFISIFLQSVSEKSQRVFFDHRVKVISAENISITIKK